MKLQHKFGCKNNKHLFIYQTLIKWMKTDKKVQTQSLPSFIVINEWNKLMIETRTESEDI